jgi:hypothetical protein
MKLKAILLITLFVGFSSISNSLTLSPKNHADIVKTLVLNCTQETTLVNGQEPPYNYQSSVTMIIESETVTTKSKTKGEENVHELVYRILWRDSDDIHFKIDESFEDDGYGYLSMISLNLNNKEYLGVAFVGNIAEIERGKCF